jgi:hypothetical protein
MQPVEPQPEPPRSRSLPPYFLPAVLIVLCGACWFLIKGWETKRQAGLYPNPITVQARETSADVPPSAPKSPDVEKPASAPSGSTLNGTAKLASPATPATSNSAVVSAQATASGPAPDSPVAPQSTFKLQGIFYRPSNPSAVVNTKTVFIGDIVNEAKVTSIDRQSVTLVHDGQTKVLTLH